jgi:hypothetical protein
MSNYAITDPLQISMEGRDAAKSGDFTNAPVPRTGSRVGGSMIGVAKVGEKGYVAFVVMMARAGRLPGLVLRLFHAKV